jgi:hypothetical protein
VLGGKGLQPVKTVRGPRETGQVLQVLHAPCPWAALGTCVVDSTQHFMDGRGLHWAPARESVLFIGTRFSNLYTSVDTPARGRVVVDLEEEPETSLAWRLTSCCRLATKLPTGLAKPARGEARPEPGVPVEKLGKRTGNTWFELFISK